MSKRYPVNQLSQERGRGKGALVLEQFFPLEHTVMSYFTDRPLSHICTHADVCGGRSCGNGIPA